MTSASVVSQPSDQVNIRPPTCGRCLHDFPPFGSLVSASISSRQPHPVRFCGLSQTPEPPAGLPNGRVRPHSTLQDETSSIAEADGDADAPANAAQQLHEDHPYAPNQATPSNPPIPPAGEAVLFFLDIGAADSEKLSQNMMAGPQHLGDIGSFTVNKQAQPGSPPGHLCFACRLARQPASPPACLPASPPACQPARRRLVDLPAGVPAPPSLRCSSPFPPGKNVNMYFLGLFLRPLGKELQPKYFFDCLFKSTLC